MDVLAAARSRPIWIATALLTALGAPAAVRADDPRPQPVSAVAPVPLYLQAAELAPAVLVEWAAPTDSQQTPVISVDNSQQQQKQQQQSGGGGSSGSPQHAPEPASVVSALTGLLLSGLGLWRRRRRQAEPAADEDADKDLEMVAA